MKERITRYEVEYEKDGIKFVSGSDNSIWDINQLNQKVEYLSNSGATNINKIEVLELRKEVR